MALAQARCVAALVLGLSLFYPRYPGQTARMTLSRDNLCKMPCATLLGGGIMSVRESSRALKQIGLFLAQLALGSSKPVRISFRAEEGIT